MSATIAFNNAADLGNNGASTNSLTASYTVGSGKNRVLFVVIVGDVINGGVDDITSVTFAGQSLFLVNKNIINDVTLGDRYSYLYALFNPPSGAANVQVKCTANHFLIVGAADYSGVEDTGSLPQSSVSNSISVVSSYTTNQTTVADNSWIFLIESGISFPNPPAAGAGLIRRAADGTFGSWGIFDSNGPITPPQSYSLTTTRVAPTIGSIHQSAAFAPFGVSAATLEEQGYRLKLFDNLDGSFILTTHDLGGGVLATDQELDIQGYRLQLHDNGDGSYSPLTTATSGASDVLVEFQGYRLRLHPTGAIAPESGKPMYALVVVQI